MVIPPGFTNVILRFLYDGDPDEMVSAFGVSTSAPPSSTIANQIKSAYQTRLGAEMRTTTTINGVTLQVGQDAGDPLTVVSNSAAFAGTGSGAGLPSNCCALLRKNTGLGGRRNRGRMFLPGLLAEANVDQNGVVSAGAITNIQTAFDLFLSDVLALAGIEELVLFHDTPPSTPTTVTAITLQSKIATQRQRMRP